MKNKVLGGLIAILLSLNLIIFGAAAIIVALLYYLSFKLEALLSLLNLIYRAWVKINKFCLIELTGTKLQITNIGKIPANSWLVVTCNHVSWADILLLQILLVDQAQPLKFFMKQSLIWVPFVGLLAKLLNYPFIKRYSLSQIKAKPHRKLANQATVEKACQLLKKEVSSLVIFPEGTRLTAEKLQRSSYKSVLQARGKGLSQVLFYWQDLAPSWLDVSLFYSHRAPTLWALLCGEIQRVILHYEVLAFDSSWVKQDNHQFQAIINQRWQVKDNWLITLQQQHCLL